jgi:hypothetical protein
MAFSDLFGGGGWSWGDKGGVDPNAGSEMDRIGSLFKGGSGVLQGLFNDQNAEQTAAQDAGFKRANLMQSYQNNLPAMLAARKKARQQASGLASLAGLY